MKEKQTYSCNLCSRRRLDGDDVEKVDNEIMEDVHVCKYCLCVLGIVRDNDIYTTIRQKYFSETFDRDEIETAVKTLREFVDLFSGKPDSVVRSKWYSLEDVKEARQHLEYKMQGEYASCNAKRLNCNAGTYCSLSKVCWVLGNLQNDMEKKQNDMSYT